MPDYSKSKIYEIVCKNTNLKYIGSTVKTLNERLYNHIYALKKGENISSKIIINNQNYIINLLEEYPCNSKKELLFRERYFIENNECVNKKVPIREKKEQKELDKKYRENNKENELKRNKIYRESKSNKDKINARRRELRLLKKELKENRTFGKENIC